MLRIKKNAAANTLAQCKFDYFHVAAQSIELTFGNNFHFDSARNGCINEVNSKSATELAGLRGSTRAQLGHCTAHSLFYNLVQKITVCELKASSK